MGTPARPVARSTRNPPWRGRWRRPGRRRRRGPRPAAAARRRPLVTIAAVKLLFVGDVVGGIGRRTMAALLPGLRERHAPDFVIVNGENAAGGVGITEKTARELLELGADAITLGNHAYRHRDVYGFLDREERIVRPANYPKGSPGRGHTTVERNGVRLGVVNLSGMVFMQAVRSPFSEADALLADLVGATDAVLLDIHAEATSEKVALGWHVDGRATACLGTHTHVPTADARVLPGGTAYVTDVGMTGPRGGVIGVKREQAIERFLTLTQVRFETSVEDPWLNAVLIEADGQGRATSIEQVLLPARL
jgi:2',3'-cyclic-nucleotide 2'-phosphodiesterase